MPLRKAAMARKVAGSRATSKPGSRFSVWRGDKYVTDIRVDKVFSVTSTCEVEGPTPIGLRSGDIAKQAGNKSAGT